MLVATGPERERLRLGACGPPSLSALDGSCPKSPKRNQLDSNAVFLVGGAATVGQQVFDQARSLEVPPYERLDLLPCRQHDALRRVQQQQVAARLQAQPLPKFRRYDEAASITHHNLVCPTHWYSVLVSGTGWDGLGTVACHLHSSGAEPLGRSCAAEDAGRMRLPDAICA